jgi:hypothetical protein
LQHCSLERVAVFAGRLNRFDFRHSGKHIITLSFRASARNRLMLIKTVKGFLPSVEMTKNKQLSAVTNRKLNILKSLNYAKIIAYFTKKVNTAAIPSSSP